MAILMHPTTTSTRSIWFAAYLLASGLPFLRAMRLPGPAFSARFYFADPNSVAQRLTREFFDNVELQRVVNARRALAEVLDAVRDRGGCDASDVADVLAGVDHAWRPPDRERVARGPVSSRIDNGEGELKT